MKIINSTKYLDFKSTKSPEGLDWYYVRRTNDKINCDSAVVITTLVKIDNEYHFLFLKTKRPPIYSENKAQYCLESPAGLIGDINSNETMLNCAHKELLEETGLKSDKMYVELINSATSAGLSSETLSYVTAIANDNNPIQPPVNDGGIITERFYVKYDEIFNYISHLDKSKISVSSPTVCGVFFALERLKALTCG